MFLLKKFLAPIFSPFVLSLELLVVGVGFLWLSKNQRTGRILTSIGLILFLMCSFEGISGRILGTLENQYSPLDLSQLSSPRASKETDLNIKWIVILAGGITGNQQMPYQLQISHDSRVRLIEGIRLHRLLPGSKLILTGGMGFNGTPEATTLSRVAEELGVNRQDMILEVEARDTKDHPRYIRELVHGDPFILVTSAYHMPRSMRIFAKQGLHPIPAPVGFWSPPRQYWPPIYFFPSAAGVRLSELAYHEYMGLAWAWLRGQV